MVKQVGKTQSKAFPRIPKSYGRWLIFSAHRRFDFKDLFGADLKSALKIHNEYRKLARLSQQEIAGLKKHGYKLSRFEYGERPLKKDASFMYTIGWEFREISNPDIKIVKQVLVMPDVIDRYDNLPHKWRLPCINVSYRVLVKEKVR